MRATQFFCRTAGLDFFTSLNFYRNLQVPHSFSSIDVGGSVPSVHRDRSMPLFLCRGNGATDVNNSARLEEEGRGVSERVAKLLLFQLLLQPHFCLFAAAKIGIFCFVGTGRKIKNLSFATFLPIRTVWGCHVGFSMLASS